METVMHTFRKWTSFCAYKIRLRQKKIWFELKNSITIWYRVHLSRFVFTSNYVTPVRYASPGFFYLSVKWLVKNKLKVGLFVLSVLLVLGIVFLGIWQFSRVAPHATNGFSLPVQKENSLLSEGIAQQESFPVVKKHESSVLPKDRFLLVVSKYHKKLWVFGHSHENGWNEKIEFPILYGKKEGNKLLEGDLKTPEGNYWVNQLLYGPDVGALYGALIFTLSYPNRLDRKVGKTGSGIWIHGEEFGKGIKRTKGCVKLSNQNMLSLFPYVYESTPVVILGANEENYKPSDLELDWVLKEFANRKLVPLPEVLTRIQQRTREGLQTMATNFLERENKFKYAQLDKGVPVETSQKVRAQLNKWKSSWAARDIESYESVFHKNFRSRENRRKESHVSRKGKIFNAHDSLYVSIEKITLRPRGNSTVQASFQQTYRSFRNGKQVLDVQDQKNVLFKRDADNWYIIRE